MLKPISDEEKAKLPSQVIVPLEEKFEDERGFIQPLVDLDFKSCVLITSRKNTIRANHYHRTDWHFCYVIEGQIEYYHRVHGSSQEPEKTTVEEGQMFFTPPMVDHTMVFRKDTTFLAYGRNSRKQEVYEADIERISMIDSAQVFTE
jgi:dTDP-4-dehydrorhamnose 3,5-epimerase-like enzyme